LVLDRILQDEQVSLLSGHHRATEDSEKASVKDRINRIFVTLHNGFLNCSTLRPASFTIPAIVKEFIGFALGMVIIRVPSVIVMCLPYPV